MLYRPDDIMAFGVNEGYSLKTIYQYKPSYFKFPITFIPDFEIAVEDFKNLPNPTITNPPQIFDERGLGWDPPIKLESSVRTIMEYIKNGGPTREINFTFSNKLLEILELKRKGEYIVPKYEDRNKV
jgi:hypothetical protein